MRANVLLVTALLFTVSLAGCLTDGAAERAPNPRVPCGELDTSYEPDLDYNPRVRLNTSNGSVTFATFLEQVPFNAGNFMDLVGQDFFDETRFHDLRPRLFIQGGDPLTRDQPRQRWGAGGPHYAVPDEFHQFLRHDEPGVVTMAQAKPNSAGSQFLITLRPLPSLDDHNTVVGQVVDGMENVSQLAQTPVDRHNRPLFGAKIHDAKLLAPLENPDEASAHLTAFGFDCEQAAQPGMRAEYMVAVRNTGQRLVNGTFDTDVDRLEGNWSVNVRNTRVVALPAGQTNVFVVDVNVPADAQEGRSYTVNATWSDPDSDAAVTRELTVNVGPLGEDPPREEPLTVHYVGVLEDGRPFTTTMPEIQEAETLTWFKDPSNETRPIRFEVGDKRVIDFVHRARVGQSVVSEVAPAAAYGTDAWGSTDLGGRLLAFQVDLLEPGSGDPVDLTGEDPGS